MKPSSPKLACAFHELAKGWEVREMGKPTAGVTLMMVIAVYMHPDTEAAAVCEQAL